VIWYAVSTTESRIVAMLFKSNNLGREIIRYGKCIKVTTTRIKLIKIKLLD